jgi:hypothetical protein
VTQRDALNAHDRIMKALQLRMAGSTYNDIAEALGYSSKTTAFHAVTNALRKAKQEPCEGVRALEIERLDAIFLPMYVKAKHGDYGAVDRCIRIMERRARLLGLDAPEKQEIETRMIVEIERETDQGAPADAAPQATVD